MGRGWVFRSHADATEKRGAETAPIYRRSGEYETTMRNPIPEVKGQTTALKVYLAQQGL